MNRKNSKKLKKIIIKKNSNKLNKIIIVMIIFTIAASALFVLASRKSVSRESSAIVNGAVAGISAAETTWSSTETTTLAETASQAATQQAMQTIIVTAKSGGYSPRKIEAKAGVPTILIMKSENAYGCERAFYIPDLNIGVSLPENGQTQFDLGVHTQGTKLVGVCGMGMYYFQIIFK